MRSVLAQGVRPRFGHKRKERMSSSDDDENERAGRHTSMFSSLLSLVPNFQLMKGFAWNRVSPSPQCVFRCLQLQFFVTIRASHTLSREIWSISYEYRYGAYSHYLVRVQEMGEFFEELRKVRSVAVVNKQSRGWNNHPHSFLHMKKGRCNQTFLNHDYNEKTRRRKKGCCSSCSTD